MILDIGCGPGAATIPLAELSGGNIFGLDNHQPFLEELEQRAKAAGVKEQIQVMNGSMLEIDFPNEAFDLIWSEGAIYIIGFEKGLREWRRLIKPGGYLALTEFVWLSDKPPDDLRKYWSDECPDIKPIEQNCMIFDQYGYQLIDHFTLPESDWWDEYYSPLLDRVKALRIQQAENQEALSLLDQEIQEISLYRKYSPYYGYEFYIAQKTTGVQT